MLTGVWHIKGVCPAVSAVASKTSAVYYGHSGDLLFSKHCADFEMILHVFCFQNLQFWPGLPKAFV